MLIALDALGCHTILGFLLLLAQIEQFLGRREKSVT
jgi:hypothetical protein